MRYSTENSSTAGEGKVKQPLVTSIRVEYDDGSIDVMEVIQRHDLLLYNLIRNNKSLGAHTATSIAALLFCTAAVAKWTEYSSRDRTMSALIQCWFKKTQESN